MRFTAAACLLALAQAAFAAGSPTLRRPLSARATALGEAFGPVPAGASSLGTNPAGLAAARKLELQTVFTSGVIDDSFGFLALAQPLPLGTAAAGVSYYDAGKVEIVHAGGARETRTAQRDFVGLFGWAAPLPGGVSVGALAKPYRFALAEQFRASGFAADLGAQWKTPLRGLALGAALQNLGSGVRFDRETDPLPRTLRGGLAWTISSAVLRDDNAQSYITATRAMFVAEAIKVRDEKLVGAAGVELAMDFGSNASIALRAGWRANSAADGMSLGIGLRESRYTLDYALGDKRSLGQTHHAGFGVRFD